MAGLGREAEAPQLHAGNRADRGLAGADDMEQPGVAGLHDAPHGVPLMGVQRVAAREPRQLEVRAVELPRSGGVEQVVVGPAQSLAALGFVEGPCREALLDQRQLLARRQCLVGVHDQTVALRVRVAHRRHLHVQRALHQLDGVQTRGAELLRHLDVLARAPFGVAHRPRPGLCRVAHLAVLLLQHLPDEVLHVAGGDPHRTEARLDGCRRQVLRLHPLQRGHVAYGLRAGGQRLPELGLDLAGQVLVGGLPQPVRGV
mmetsp:Transcript_61806/g.146249  ORF Transcript_61806/g.146249 Transcript_61806/m.146249 type:complete len:258 (+) Transcript_61806:3335-4108(+)